ncbi:MAG: DUF4214 domain-containing protein [Telluria sp.]
MYDSDTSTVTSALQSSSPAVFTDDTISKILALTTHTDDTKVVIATATPDASGNVSVTPGAEVVMIQGGNLFQTQVKPPANAPVLIFEGKGGVAATINDGTTVPAHAAGVVDRVVVGTAGNDNIVIADAKNTHITLGSGNSFVTTGAGADTVVAGLGNSTIAGGTGHAIVELKGSASDYQVSQVNGHAVVVNATTHTTTDITKIQYVQLDSGKALVFANDSNQAAISTLFQSTFGRTATSTELTTWFNKAAAGESLTDIAAELARTTEFQTHTSTLSDTDFVNALYQQTFGRAAEDAGLAYWLNALQTGGATRAQLTASFADIASHTLDHTSLHTEAQVIGSVTIVHNIV